MSTAVRVSATPPRASSPSSSGSTRPTTRRSVADSPWGGRIALHEGNAADVLPRLSPEGPFDLLFVDADKGRYDLYGRWAAENLRRGGLLVADNVYLFGRLLEESAEAAAMRRFHEEAARAFDTVCVPTPDGLLVGVRR